MADNILHYASIRLRATGTGVLRPQFLGLDDVETLTLSTITMSTAPGREPVRLVNFKNQRARLKLSTTAIDEVMNIDKIIIYVKPLWTSYPG
jgi:hypothetical protein